MKAERKAKILDPKQEIFSRYVKIFLIRKSLNLSDFVESVPMTFLHKIRHDFSLSEDCVVSVCKCPP